MRADGHGKDRRLRAADPAAALAAARSPSGSPTAARSSSRPPASWQPRSTRASHLRKFLRIRNTVVFGGVGHDKQERALATVPDVLVATPGRLLDLLDRQRRGSPTILEVFVLDEADRMLDMGFIHDVRR
jgi:hypothetical protein